MFSALISGLRSLRVSLVTGAILVASVYIFAYGSLITEVEIRPAARSLLELSSLVPIILFLSLCLIAGSLYSTLLEGIVDGLHRKNVFSRNNSDDNGLKKRLLQVVAPYSDSAEKRLRVEVERFYRSNVSEEDVTNRTELENDFIDNVLIETLWMEGKLAGTDLESPYDKIRSEGEMRVAGGLLIPLASTATAFSLWASEWQIVASCFGGIILAIPTVNYGLYYYKKANSFLAHHIADGKVLCPSMETLKRVNNPQKQTEDDVQSHSNLR